MRFAKKVAIVPGAASGIGEAIAQRFAEEGCSLVLNDLAAEPLQRVAGALRGQGIQVEVLPGDISDEEIGTILANRARSTFGKLNILVNDAADFTAQSVEAATITDWQRVLGVNVVGTALVSKAAIPLLKENGGAIVDLASISSFIAQPNFATYNASKGAAASLTRCMAPDLAHWGIRVNSACPGRIFPSASEREIARLGMTTETGCRRWNRSTCWEGSASRGHRTKRALW
jgi:NAD(P)-dependent dehydrogenase (short-subunit alcohol dehydrogenase family)